MIQDYLQALRCFNRFVYYAQDSGGLIKIKWQK